MSNKITLGGTYVHILTGVKTTPQYQFKRGGGFTIIHVRENNHGRGEWTPKKEFIKYYKLEKKAGE